MTRKQKRMLIRILIAAVLFLAALITDHTLHPSMWIVLPIFAAAYLVVGWDILWKAIRNISHGQIFDENFLMAIASLGAFAMQEFDESVAVMLLYQIGELFQSYAVNKSRNAISSLVELRPDVATAERNGEYSAEEIEKAKARLAQMDDFRYRCSHRRISPPFCYSRR